MFGEIWFHNLFEYKRQREIESPTKTKAFQLSFEIIFVAVESTVLYHALSLINANLEPTSSLLAILTMLSYKNPAF